MVRKSKNMKFLKILTLLFLLSTYFFSLVSPIIAQGTEYLGEFEYTFYLDGPFTGTCDRTRQETTTTIHTYYGIYKNITLSTRSDIKAEHSSKGYFEIKNSENYFDTNDNLVKSQSSWSLHVSGYQQVSWESMYEYGNYVVLQNTPTVYEETYTYRYYEDGSYQKSVNCRDHYLLECAENITVPAGTFNCTRIKMTFYEDGSYSGYTLAWEDNDGFLIELKQYDDSNDIWVHIKLLSKTSAEALPSFNISFSIFSILLIIISLIIKDIRKKPKD